MVGSLTCWSHKNIRTDMEADHIGILIEGGGLEEVYKDEPALISWSSRESKIVETLTFAQFSFATKRVSELLQQHGIKIGDSVALLSHPTVDYHIVAASLLRLGAVVVNINYRQPLSTMQYMTSVGKANKVLTSRHFIHTALALDLPHTTAETTVIVIDRLSESDIEATEQFATSKKWSSIGLLHKVVQKSTQTRSISPSLSRNKKQLSGHDIAVIMFTSGSSGMPKAVPLTHRGLLWSCRAKLEAHGGMSAVEKGTLAFLPNYHVMGFVNNFIFNVCVGRCPMFIHADCEETPLSLDVLLDACVSLKPSMLDTVPHMLERLALYPHLDEYIHALILCERVLYGGCSLSDSALVRLRDRGLRLASQYGQTELGGMVLLGEPGYGAEMRLLPELKHRMTEQGELVLLNCESAMREYLTESDTCPELDNGANKHVSQAEHHTHDIFDTRTERGVTWFTHRCRVDDLIVHNSGEMTNPIPIENLLFSELPGCRPCVTGQRRPYPVLIIEPQDRDQTYSLFRSSVVKALTVVNASSPAYSKLLNDRILIVNPGVLPVSAKGNIIRGEVESMFSRDMDRMDHILEGTSEVIENKVTTSYSDSSMGAAVEGLADIPDSLMTTKRQNDTRSNKNTAIAHVLALCMLSVLLSHSLWPRMFFWSNIGCGWVSHHRLLNTIHQGFEVLCMPGFVALAGLKDLELVKKLPTQFHDRSSGGGTKLLMNSAIRVSVAYLVLFALSEHVALAYLHGDTDCSGTAMRKVLWFLVFLASCRVLKVMLITADVSSTLSVLLYLGLHIWTWGRLPLDSTWAPLNYILIDCKMSNYGIFYFVLAPLLSMFSLPSERKEQERLFDQRQLLSMCLFIALGLWIPFYYSDWFQHSYQFLSEMKGGPLIGKDGNAKALIEHCLQLIASSLMVAFCLEAVPRRRTLFSSLGEGTFSCFVLHWWLRPIWLSALTRLLAHVAPLLQPCLSDSTQHAVGIWFSGIVLIIILFVTLLVVQYSLSGIWIDFGEAVSIREDDRLQLRTLQWHNVRKFISLKLCYMWALLKGRSLAIGVSLIKLVGHACLWFFFASVLLRHSGGETVPGKGKLYLGAKCAAVVTHSSLHVVGTRSNLPPYKPNMPTKPLLEGGGVCLLMNGGVPFKPSICDNRHQIQGHMLAACLNRDYACSQGYHFIHANSPRLNLLPEDLAHKDVKSKALEAACTHAGAILHYSSKYMQLTDTQHGMLRSGSWCRVLLMERTLEIYSDTCKAVAFVEPDIAFMGVPLQNHSLSKQVMTTDKLLVTGRKQDNPRSLSSAYLFAVNNRDSRSLLRDWWRQVDDFPDQITAGGDKRPYKQFRNSGLREESMLQELIIHGYNSSIGVSSEYSDFGEKGNFVRKVKKWTPEFNRKSCGKESSIKVNRRESSKHGPSQTSKPPLASKLREVEEGGKEEGVSDHQQKTSKKNIPPKKTPPRAKHNASAQPKLQNVKPPNHHPVPSHKRSIPAGLSTVVKHSNEWQRSFSTCTEVVHSKLKGTCSQCLKVPKGGSCSKCIQLGFNCTCTAC